MFDVRRSVFDVWKVQDGTHRNVAAGTHNLGAPRARPLLIVEPIEALAPPSAVRCSSLRAVLAHPAVSRALSI